MVLYLPTYVDPPTVTPLPYGLMSVVQMKNDADNVHWRNGVMFQPDVCDPAQTTMAQCPVVTGYGKNITSDGLPAKGGLAFTVYADIACSPQGNFYEEAEARARAALTNGEGRAVENAFWTGQITSPATDILYPHLASTVEVFDSTGEILLQPAATTIVTGALNITEAIGALEAALGVCYGGVGTIHAPRALFARFARAHQIKQSGGVTRTWAETPIAFGAGYPGTAPDGSTPPAGTLWMYGTGAVMARRSDIFITSSRAAALDRNVDTLRLFAERTYQISWDCCLFAVPVLLSV